jgi:hypothetical protein
MPKVPKEKKRAPNRPLLKIDWKVVDQMLEAHCLGTEIAARIGVSADTLYMRCLKENNSTFSEYSQRKKASGKSLLRLKQYNAAMQGDKSLLIWLGKNILNQSEKQSIEHSGEVPIQVVSFSNKPIMPWKGGKDEKAD